jgi:methylated-DNA-protein-cysteine methyltransferase related protein
MATNYERIYAVVRRVPRGKVATYGQVARLAGLNGQARLVGYAMHALPTGTAVPWHRVINAHGMISLRRTGDSLSQRMLLEREGVSFDAAGRTSLTRFAWKPNSTRAKRTSRAR